MKIQIEVSLEYGIMFLHDAYSDVEFPEDTGAAPITFTGSCICFQVASYIDGNANVSISNEPYSVSIKPSFSHRILTTSKFISITDVPVNYYGIMALKNEFADINIWNYEVRGQEFTWIQIENLSLF